MEFACMEIILQFLVKCHNTCRGIAMKGPFIFQQVIRDEDRIDIEASVAQLASAFGC